MKLKLKFEFYSSFTQNGQTVWYILESSFAFFSSMDVTTTCYISLSNDFDLPCSVCHVSCVMCHFFAQFCFFFVIVVLTCAKAAS